MSGTPQCIEDRHRGIYSYEALRSRLAEGRFSGQQHHDMLGPVLRLQPLTNEEMFVLAEKLAHIHASLYGYEQNLKEQDIADFIKIEYGRIGADQNITPREVIRDFIELLDILLQNPGIGIQKLLQSGNFDYAKPDLEERNEQVDTQFAEFTI